MTDATNSDRLAGYDDLRNPQRGGEMDDEGWALDEYGNQYGYCNGCGEESQAERDCCADGEVVPYGS